MSTGTPSPTGARTTLVIGAGGRHGGTGSHVVRRLRERRHEVRVLVRTDDERAQHLRDLGARIVVGDLLDQPTLGAAVRGVDAVYFTYPVAPGIVQAAANLAAALRQAGSSPRLVVMSMAVAAADNPSGLGRAQWAAEEVLGWAGLEPTILRFAALFYENIPLLHAESIRRSGAFGNSFGAAVVPWISGLDAADLAVTALLDPARYPRGSTHYPQGAAAHSHADIAALIGAETGTPVTFTAIPAARWRREIEDLADSTGTAVNSAMAQHISAIGAGFARLPAAPPADTTALAAAIGRPPQTFTEYVRAHRHHFVPAHAR
ncbi:NAD(P)H-binding protein [Nocardia asteroides]|uniref:NmrA family NAD(P)-binding protein n=1 Tax=Nocardia asteroides TaxID=1824 RepID=UPI001E46D274|nr:NAD(P)H-binding protein [Nocardia asteroides]UGT61972.1 NAD(P)H-binding protein [Nocardia asteroides]